MSKTKEEKQLEFEKQIVKPFEFVLKINDNIICQRYFNIKGYNNECRESLEMKEMMDDIMGVNQQIKLGVIPDFFKYRCVVNSYKPYYNQNNYLNDKDDIFSLEVLKNNVNKLRNKNNDFNLDDLQKEKLVEGTFDGKMFHPNVRYEIDIRSIIPEIIGVIQDYLGSSSYTKEYGDVSLKRNNRLTQKDRLKLVTY
jgi:hypothetical protein